ncbi:Alpha/Beta hydrolase protein [Geopyxis carbonaria]|nr:Alpha/Beta hydrolase protein [Geopyxis carbonaria]
MVSSTADTDAPPDAPHVSAHVQKTLDLLALNDKLLTFSPSSGPLAVMPTFSAAPRQFTDMGMSITYNHPITTRDGITLAADLFLPTNATGPLPTILCITPYGKQNVHDPSLAPPSHDFDPGLDGVTHSRHFVFEGGDPPFWTRAGFAFVAADTRGSFASGGAKLVFVGRSDGADGHDIVEHLASLPWSNGRVGMLGASALGHIQWQTAATAPPHLAAICVQDAWTDGYREIGYRGGVPALNFAASVRSTWLDHGNRPATPVHDTGASYAAHPFRDHEYWSHQRPALGRITAPAYVVAGFADKGLHLPGSLRGWRHAASTVKFLELHQFRKWEWQLTPESLGRQRAWFEHTLLGRDTLRSWPPVRLAVAEKHNAATWRDELTWPPAHTKMRRLHLAPDGALSDTPAPADAPALAYDALTGSASWTTTFPAATEITGCARLHLRISTTSAAAARDIDLHVTLQKLTRDGAVVAFPYHTFINDGHVSWGWARASNRVLEPLPDTAGEMVEYTCTEGDAELLGEGEVVEVEVGLQATSTVFRRGEGMRVVVQGRDFGVYTERSPVPRAGTGRNGGVHTVHLGEGCWVEVPVVGRPWLEE